MNSILNDMKYNFEPLVLFQPATDYQPDEVALKRSIEKNKMMIARLQESKAKN